MTDLEITKLCAEALGYDRFEWQTAGIVTGSDQPICLPEGRIRYDPLHDDAQAMALVKKFHLGLAWSDYCSVYEQGNGANGSNDSVNRAICECCAKMMLAKKGVSDDAKAQGGDR